MEGGKRWTSRGSATAPFPSSTSPSRRPLPRAGTASALMHPRCPNCYLRKQKSPSCLLLHQKKKTVFPLCCSCCLLATGGSGFIQRRQGPQASFPALDRGREYKLYKSHWSTVCQFLVVFALDLVRCFHVSEKRLLSVSVDL